MTQAQPMDSMRSWLAFSIAIHTLILALMIFGLPYFHPKPRDLPPMISVELVEMGKETTTNKVSDANKVVKQPEEQQPAPPTPPPPQAQQAPPQPEPQPTPPQPRPEMQAAPEVAPVDTTVPELEIPEVVLKRSLPDAPKLAAVDTKVPELTVPPKVDLKKVPPKPQADPFQALLKNLTKDAPQPIADQQPVPQAKTPPRPPSGAQAPISASLTASETDAVRRQLDQCMSWPTADQDLRNLSFDVEIVVNPDRTVASAQIVDQSRMGDPVFAAAARAALRAVRMTQCTPLELPPEKYQAWHDMTVTFSPPKG